MRGLFLDGVQLPTWTAGHLITILQHLHVLNVLQGRHHKAIKIDVDMNECRSISYVFKQLITKDTIKGHRHLKGYEGLLITFVPCWFPAQPKNREAYLHILVTILTLMPEDPQEQCNIEYKRYYKKNYYNPHPDRP